jgi:phosphoglycerol transferase MdoB-like AlkP superfamily enzyme
MNTIAYILYLFITYLITVRVGLLFYRNGRLFILDLLKGDVQLTDYINRILLVGYYLLNLGYAFWIMEVYDDISNSRNMLEILSAKIGGYCIYLGISLFFNLYLFFRGRRVSKEKSRLVSSIADLPKL